MIECYRSFIRGLLDVTDNIVEGRVVAPPAGAAARRRRSLSGGGGGQGHRDFLRHRQCHRGRIRLLARRCVCLRRLGRLRPQKDGHHRARRVGVRQAPLSRARPRHPARALHGRRHRRHVGRRVRQRHAAVAADPAGRGVQSSAYFPRPEPRSGSAASANASACFGCRARAGTTTTQRLLSRGGAIYRTQRQVACTLSREAQRLLELPQRRAEPGRDHPRHPVHAGRSAVERRHRHLRQGRRANGTARSATAPTMRVRVDGRQVRARWSAKAAISGFSQRGRIEYALGGGRINADFIDNSAGVNTSDVEVNLKILLDAPERRAGRARAPQSPAGGGHRRGRGAGAAQQLSAEPGDQPAWSSAPPPIWASISSCCAGSSATASSIARSSSCPSDEELEERRRQGRGLTRPELALLLAYGKIALNHALTESGSAEDPYLAARAAALLSGRAAAPIPRAHRAPSPAQPDHHHRDSPTASSIASAQRC